VLASTPLDGLRGRRLDAQDFDHLTENTIKNEIVPVRPAAHAETFIARHQCVPARRIDKTLTPGSKLQDESHCSVRIVLCNQITDSLKFGLRSFGDDKII
jgi:hypothetical protein